MKRLLQYFLLLIASVGITYLAYAIMMWGFHKASEFFGVSSTSGKFFGHLYVSLSHLGFGLVIFPVLVVIVFFLLKKIWIKV